MVGDSMGGAPCCGCVSGLGKAPVTLGLEKCHWLTPVGVGFLPKSSIFFLHFPLKLLDDFLLDLEQGNTPERPKLEAGVFWMSGERRSK